MKSLQERSTEITVKLKNRKQFEEELFKLLDSIILAPEFLNEITDNEIDELFASSARLIAHPLSYRLNRDQIYNWVEKLSLTNQHPPY